MIKQRAISVSLCMIVRNEAHQLADCLAPIAGLFDEIVVVDTGSRDATQNIARRFTPNVFDFAWCDDFSAARNASLRHAHGDWVFWLDADDRITPLNLTKLRHLLDGISQEPRMFLMNTICRAGHARQVERVVSHSRLFRRHPALAWRRRVHEQLDPHPASLGFPCVLSDVQIDHLGYGDLALARRKQQRNIRLLQMDYAVDPDDTETLTELGIAYTRLGKGAEARRYFDRLFQTAPSEWMHSRRVLASLAEFATLEGNFQQVVDISERGLVLYPGDEYLAFLQAEALYQLGEYDHARILLLRIINGVPRPEQLCVGAPDEIQRRLAPLGLSEIFRLQGAFDQGEALLRSVVRVFPRDPACWHQLGRICVAMASRAKLRDIVAALSTCERGALYMQLLEAEWQMAHGTLQMAEQLIEESLGEEPELPLPRAMRVECLQRRGASCSAQLEACRDVLRVQPGNRHVRGMMARLERTRPAAWTGMQHESTAMPTLTAGACPQFAAFG